MTSPTDLRDIQTSVARAKDHAKIAAVLLETDQEWGAVCGFYSAYHLIRASMLADQVFDDQVRLSKINEKILPEDKYVTKHSKGGLRSASFGINELVTCLYPNIRSRYYRLHMLSCKVRYEQGLRPGELALAQEDLAEITRAFDAGEIVCDQHPSK